MGSVFSIMNHLMMQHVKQDVLFSTLKKFMSLIFLTNRNWLSLTLVPKQSVHINIDWEGLRSLEARQVCQAYIYR